MMPPRPAPFWFYLGTRGFIWIRLLFLAHLHITGVSNIPKSGGCILAINHVCDLDAPVVAMPVSRRIVYMGVEKLFRGETKWSPSLLRLLGGFPVLSGPAVWHSLQIARSVLQRGQVLGIFPEGRQSHMEGLLPAQDGVGLLALQTRVPVVPVAVWGTDKIFHERYPDVQVCFGAPLYYYDLSGTPSSDDKDTEMVVYSRKQMHQATERIMYAIAAMLPKTARGVYL